ncbi:sensor domain-containing diguanylate cyclase [bacterium]|nr:MAG: sensor domain-containing diguanylate cyclase [bacterium]
MSFQNAPLFKTEQQLRGRAELLQKATTALTAELELPQLLEQVMDYLGGVVSYDSVCLFLVEGDGGTVRAVAGRGFDKPNEIIDRLYKSDTLFSIVARQKSPLVLQDTLNDDRFCRWGGAEHIRGWMCLPLIWREKIIGFMTVDSRKVNAYNNEDAKYAQAFANQAASAIQISRLFTEAQALAISDPLTGVYNRRYFFELAGQHVASARESNQTASAIMIDVDNYKKVNDTYGHLSGDQILKVVTECFTSVLSEEEILARMGGDEFIILLPNQNRAQAEHVAERLRSTLEHAAIRVKDAEVAVTASFGVAEIDPARMDLDDMINRADQALYFSKNAGRNTVS